ncbi:MAG: DUF493 domain-containing protein [Gammaproteobacteria bacterium]|nr:DUF493 domain-containing protein [Gammaproteobacteria bacterium]
MQETAESALTFPCRFPIKVLAAVRGGFDATVVEIVRRHAPGLSEAAVTTRLSRGGRYVSVTVTVEAESREQIDAIYRALTADDRVLMVL